MCDRSGRENLISEEASKADVGARSPRWGRGGRLPGIRAGGVVSAVVLAALAIAGCAGSFTKSATNVRDTTATVRGSVSDFEDATISYWFEYGPTKSYGSETPHRTLDINDRDAHSVSEDLTGLDPGTTYHYRACAKHPVAVCANDRSFTTSGGATQLSIAAEPALYPDFDPQVSDYVTRCAGGPVEMTVVAPADTDIAIDGGPPRNGSFSKQVPLQAGQSFSFTRTTGAASSIHHVRCLPADFPEWNFQSFAPAEQKFYVVAVGDYVFALDGDGVPLWWYNDNGAPSDAKYLDDGTFAWATGRATPNARYAIRGLDGSLEREMKTVGTPTDGHDLQLLANGNYMLMSYRERAGTVDLSAYGGPPDGTVVDAELQELTPAGTKVWDWNSKDHTGLEETDHWFDDFVFPVSGPKGPFDIVHINSVDVNADSVLISMRHTDGVYKIDRASGEIIWKLGGTPTPESLTVVGDPYGADPFGGQHDARMHADGTLTAFDNGQTRDRPPRGVRFQIDEGAGTATYLGAISDPDVPEAVCCGSARRTASGGWLVGWGGLPGLNPIIEFAADGSRTFKLNFPTGFSYRAHPIAAGQLGRAALRNGMDAQHPR
jgi:Arylsulfotransferase (ASST)